MSNVIIDREKIDILANAISDKSGVPVTMTLDEMVEAVDGIETEPNLQAKTYTVDSAGTETIEADSGYDGLSEVEVTVPQGVMGTGCSTQYVTVSGVRKWKMQPYAAIVIGDDYGTPGFIADETVTYGDEITFNAIASGTTITPTESAQTIGGANYMMAGAVTVNAIPSNYIGSGITQRSSSDITASGATVTVPSGYYSAQASKAVASGTEGTPTATKGTVSNHQVSVTPSVTNTTGYITGSTKTGTAVTVSASELVSGTYTVDSSGTKDVTNYASASVPAGTAGTPSASKGAVSNHSVSVTPSVINTTGWITGSTKTGTAVTVSASELVSGSQTITSNQTVDVTNLAELVVNVGGGTPMQIETNIVASSYTSSTVTFTGLKGEPKAFWVIHGAAIATGTPSKVASIVFDGTSMHGQIVTNTSNAQASYSTSFSYTYSNGTLTITSSNATFISANYILTYAYGGGVVDTKDVQVGSGATSITFTGLEAEPTLWSCIFKSNFSTSNGYQRVMYVEHEDSSTIGFYMDSSANPNPTYWSYSYNNGSLTITSQGTNAGGYFHQPGYYQLTYAYDDGSSGNYQSKTVTPTTSQQVVEADSGYDALKRVTVNAMPSGSATAPASISGTAASVSTGTNTLTLTKTVSVTPTVSAGYVSAGTAGNSSVSLTASVTTKAAATITPTTTNQTIAAGTYLTGIQTIAGDADLVGSNILSTANIFGVQGTVVVQNYYTGSSAPSSSLGSNGDLYLQA